VLAPARLHGSSGFPIIIERMHGVVFYKVHQTLLTIALYTFDYNLFGHFVVKFNLIHHFGN